MIGPTAGFFPDPLFARGVAAIGGAEVRFAEQARQRLSANQGLGESARKFLVSPNRNTPDWNRLCRVYDNKRADFPCDCSMATAFLSKEINSSAPDQIPS